jgi:hypothetical protein
VKNSIFWNSTEVLSIACVYIWFKSVEELFFYFTNKNISTLFSIFKGHNS